MNRAVIFDFGGVLMKTIDDRPRHEWNDRLALPRGSVEHIVHASPIWHKAQIGQVSAAEYWADIARQLNLSATEVRQLEIDYFSGDRLDSELIDFIRSLRMTGHQIALLSNDSAALPDKLKSLGIADLFDPLIVSALIGVMKPDPAAYHAALDALQCLPQETIFVDDRLDNIAAANALGIHAVHYINGMDLPAALKPLLTTT